eukprot:TRINITY_DN45_c4_g1_i2.p1 TRINITY_DN45_c4_g1~~TRINITY_DN45_c4_g1_i2.p1  ORF type:complete len:336 (-),score=119.86 TRINITY_DN45_c4_g1_i2:31-1038(-)
MDVNISNVVSNESENDKNIDESNNEDNSNSNNNNNEEEEEDVVISFKDVDLNGLQMTVDFKEAAEGKSEILNLLNFGRGNIQDAIIDIPFLGKGQQNEYLTQFFQLVNEGKYYEVGDLLSKHKDKIDINVKNADGKTALHLAVCNRDLKMAKALLQQGNIDVNCKTTDLSQTPLIMALATDCKEMVELLLLFKADVNVRDFQGRTLLYCATCIGAKNMIERLLNVKDIDINEPNDNNEGHTPLLAAIVDNNYELIEFLLKKGANANQVCGSNNECSTALQVAVLDHSDKKLVQLLIDYNADANQIDVNSGVPLIDIVSALGNEDMAKFLLNQTTK